MTVDTPDTRDYTPVSPLEVEFLHIYHRVVTRELLRMAYAHAGRADAAGALSASLRPVLAVADPTAGSAPPQDADGPRWPRTDLDDALGVSARALRSHILEHGHASPRLLLAEIYEQRVSLALSTAYPPLLVLRATLYRLEQTQRSQRRDASC